MKPCWEKAAGNWSGAGLQAGARVRSFKGHLKALDKAGKLREAACLLTIGAGATWPAQRRHQQGMVARPSCS
eukprot:9385203-Lingulodinium_polyedra.AAC.1